MTPKLVTCDCAYGIITPTKEIFTTSYILLDEYHINKNQLKLVVALSKRSDCDETVAEISNELLKMHQSTTAEPFFSRRTEF